MNEIFLSAFVAGILVGGLYAAVSIGLGFIFGIVRVINFAHGALIMMFLYASFWLWYLLGIDPYVSILIVVPVAFIVGYGVHYFFVRPMFIREKSYVVEPMSVLLVTAGLDLILSNLALLVFKSDLRAVKVPYGLTTVDIAFLSIGLSQLILFGITVLLVVGLTWLLTRTELGNRIQAVGQNREAAVLCGLNVHHIFSVTFGLGCAVTAIGGCAMLPFYYAEPQLGLALCVKAFIIVVLGGLGSIPGAFLGGLIIGVVESVAGQFVAPTSASIFSLMLFLVIVFFRPKGLMGILEQ